MRYPDEEVYVVGQPVWWRIPGEDPTPAVVSKVLVNWSGESVIYLDFGPGMLRSYQVLQTHWGWLADRSNRFDLEPIE